MQHDSHILPGLVYVTFWLNALLQCLQWGATCHVLEIVLLLVW